ncbi:MAG: Trm112 family protein [Candidatus Fermentithermobacillus carboniphilus]|uniref:Trm112 family protein n=1 Tax=Candidatus Fermentithermobacillus carboniphilus TaxID=3085328 RepID=A0AAT9LE08_9FIRM|nr:MAG: Trm112 family protein [Candidatus Fermentithermobacillus carboniphilus]
MREHLRDLLVCPACRGELTWDIFEVENSDTQIAIEDTGVGGARAPDYDVMEGRAECSACGATYSVKDGIGAFLTPDVQREDLWEEVDSHLSAFLKENLK